MKWKSCLKRWIAAAVAGGMMCMMGGVLPKPIQNMLTAPITASAYEGYSSYSSENPYPKYNDGTIRSCTSVAWECVYKNTGIKMAWLASEAGNAGNWYDNYGSKGCTVYNNTVPSPGDIACWKGGEWGHVAYILDVNTANQTMTVYEGGFHWVDQDGKQHTGSIGNGLNIATNRSYQVGNSWDGKTLVGFIDPENDHQAPDNIGDEFWALIMQPSSMKTMVVNTKGKLVLGSNQNKDETAGYWHFYRQDDGSYRIRSYYNNLFLSVDKDADENGAVLCVNEWAGGVSQDWWIYQNGDKFKFRPNTSADKVIDIDSGSQEDGAKCQIWHDTNAEQQWNYLVKVDPLDLGECFIAEITQESSGKPLVPNAKGTIVLGDSQNKDKSARWWRFTRNSDRTYSVQSIYNQQFLCVSNKSNENGAGIKTISWNGDKVHDWKIFGMGAGLLISPSYTYKALDIDSGSTADGTKVQLWNAENTGTQRLAVNKITPADYGKEFYAEIDQASSGKPLIVNASSNIVLGASQSGAKASQYWHFVQNADGSYQIQSYDTKNYLEAAGAKDEDGTLLVAKNSSSSQSWFIYDYGNMSTMIPSFSKTLKALDIDSGSTEDGTKVHLWTASKSDTQSIRINQKTQAEITEALTLKGDCNSDGKTNVTDLVLLQKWILKVPKTSLKDAGAADMNADGVVDIFDLALLKRKLLQTK